MRCFLMTKVVPVAVIAMSLFFAGGLVANEHLESCHQAWQQSSAYQSCVKSDTAITSDGTHCNIEAVCLNECTWKKLTDMNNVTVSQVSELQNCDGQLAHTSSNCKIDNENRCWGDN